MCKPSFETRTGAVYSEENTTCSAPDNTCPVCGSKLLVDPNTGQRYCVNCGIIN